MTDKKLKPVIEYYDNGKIERAYSVDENGKKDGPYEVYYKNGQLYKKWTYKDGKYDGPYERYLCNGQLKVKCTYKNGEYDGPYESYHDNGQLWTKFTYRDDKKDGLYEEYDDNGQLKEIKVYKEGNPLYGEKAAEYLKGKYPIEYKELQAIKLKEAREKPIRKRKGLCARLAQMNKQMAPTQLRQSAKRAEVAKFRAKFPNKKDGR